MRRACVASHPSSLSSQSGWRRPAAGWPATRRGASSAGSSRCSRRAARRLRARSRAARSRRLPPFERAARGLSRSMCKTSAEAGTTASRSSPRRTSARSSRPAPPAPFSCTRRQSASSSASGICSPCARDVVRLLTPRRRPPAPRARTTRRCRMAVAVAVRVDVMPVVHERRCLRRRQPVRWRPPVATAKLRRPPRALVLPGGRWRRVRQCVPPADDVARGGRLLLRGRRMSDRPRLDAGQVFVQLGKHPVGLGGRVGHFRDLVDEPGRDAHAPPPCSAPLCPPAGFDEPVVRLIVIRLMSRMGRS